MKHPPVPHTLRLGTRGSLLARTQSALIVEQLKARHPTLQVVVTSFKTSGDQIADRPLHALGGKGLFTRELEQALLDGRIDFAVHSFKDVPVTMPLVEQAGLMIAAVPAREDARDLLISSVARTLDELPRGARVGTGSLRRRCQLLDRRPDLQVTLIRGNIDTRLARLRQGEYDAIVLALAGLRRTGLFDPTTMSVIDPDQMLPAPGQGALALQCRRDDLQTLQYLSALADPATTACVEAERELVRLLEGDCHSPIAAYATFEESESAGASGQRRMRFLAAVGRRDGSPPVVRTQVVGSALEPSGVAADAHAALVGRGVERLLRPNP